MIVQCPRCSTRWRVGDTTEDDNPTFKCGRCHNVFRRFPGAPLPHEKPAASGRTRTAPEVNNLEFIFPQRREPAPGEDHEARSTSRSTADEASMEDTSGESTMAAAAALDLPAGPADDPCAENSAGSLNAEPGSSHAPLDPGKSGEQNDTGRDAPTPRPEPAWTLHVEETMSASAPIPAFGPIRRALLLLVAAHALLAVLIRVNPERGGQWLARVPLLSAALAERPALARAIRLRNVEGRFQHIRNARRVFVVSGETVNNSRSALERIEVETTLYGPSGELDRKTVSTGNRTTLRLSELSESEIVLLHRFDPRVTLGPGESAPFSIVFLQPPGNLLEFSSRVSSVRPTGPFSAPPQTHRARRPPSVG